MGAGPIGPKVESTLQAIALARETVHNAFSSGEKVDEAARAVAAARREAHELVQVAPEGSAARDLALRGVAELGEVDAAALNRSSLVSVDIAEQVVGAAAKGGTEQKSVLARLDLVDATDGLYAAVRNGDEGAMDAVRAAVTRAMERTDGIDPDITRELGEVQAIVARPVGDFNIITAGMGGFQRLTAASEGMQSVRLALGGR